MNSTNYSDHDGIEVSPVALPSEANETSLSLGVRRICQAHAGRGTCNGEEVAYPTSAPDALQTIVTRAYASSTPLIVRAFGSELVAMSPRVLEALLYDRACLEAYYRRS